MTVPDDDLLVVGHIRKAHGLKGEVVVRLSTNRTERLAAGSRLFTEQGELVVSASRPKDSDHLVMFDGIATREQADELRGTELLAPPIEDPDELWVHELITKRVVDQHGVDRGEVVEVQMNPASDLLVLDSELLVPVVFVTEVGPDTITVDAPEGLFDL